MAKQEELNKQNMAKIEENLESDDPWLERQKSISGEPNNSSE